MLMIHSLEHFYDSANKHYGFDQDWYHKPWQRQAGCGPTVAAEMLYYQKARPVFSRNHAIDLMEKVWSHITPGLGGVNRPAHFVRGLKRYLQFHELDYPVSVIEIAHHPKKRVSLNDVCTFIETSIVADQPVAFLNLHNGSIEKLESWHWVLIVGIDSFKKTVTILDNGSLFELNIQSWYENTKMRGALVTLAESH